MTNEVIEAVQPVIPFPQVLKEIVEMVQLDLPVLLEAVWCSVSFSRTLGSRS